MANDVETEQILHDPQGGDCVDGQFTSYTQLRASIPVFWTQDGNLMVGQPMIVGMQNPTRVNPPLLKLYVARYNAHMAVCCECESGHEIELCKCE